MDKSKIKALGDWLGSASGFFDFIKSVGLWALAFPTLAGIGSGIWQYIVSDSGPFAILVGLTTIYICMLIFDWMKSKGSSKSLEQRMDRIEYVMDKLVGSVFLREEEFESNTIELEAHKHRLELTKHLAEIRPSYSRKNLPMEHTFDPDSHTASYFDSLLSEIKSDCEKIETALNEHFKYDDDRAKQLRLKSRGRINSSLTNANFEDEVWHFPSFEYYKLYKIETELLDNAVFTLDAERSNAAERVEEILAN